jgi:hypothetical protein
MHLRGDPPIAGLAMALILVGCGFEGPGPSPTVAHGATSGSPSLHPSGSIAVADGSLHSTSNPASSSSSVCRLESDVRAATPVPAGQGRCEVTVFSPPMSFAAGAGLFWAGDANRWALSQDDQFLTRFLVYRYGGAVVLQACVNPPTTRPLTTVNDIVAWLKSAPGVSVVATARSVGPHPAWQVDLAAQGVPSCPGDRGKIGTVWLWTIDAPLEGRPFQDKEFLDSGARLRVYLIQLPTQIVVITVRRDASGGQSPDNGYLGWAEQVFVGLQVP